MLYLSFTRTNQTENYFYNQVAAIVANGSNYTTKCEKCLAATSVFHEAAISQPVSVITDMLIRVCRSSSERSVEAMSADSSRQGNLTHFPIYAATGEAEFSGIGGLGPYWAQL